MPTVIRMKRGGRTHAPYYRIVVMDSRNRNRGREVEQLGIYHPCARPEPITEINVKKALEWLYKGAQCSDTARTVLSRKGVLKAFADGVKPADLVEEAPAPEPAGLGIPAPEAESVEASAVPVEEAPEHEAQAIDEPVEPVEPDAAPAPEE